MHRHSDDEDPFTPKRGARWPYVVLAIVFSSLLVVAVILGSYATHNVNRLLGSHTLENALFHVNATLRTHLSAAEQNLTDADYLLQEGLAAASHQIQTVNSSVFDAFGQIETLNSGLVTTNSRIDTLESAIGTSNARIDTLESGLGTANSSIDTLESSLTATNSRIDTLDSSLVTTNSRVDTLNSSLEATNTLIDTVNSTIFAIITSPEADAVALGRIDEVHAALAIRIDTLNTTVSTNSASIDTLNTTVGANSASIASVNATVVSNSASITSLSSTVSSNSASISTLSSTVSSNTAAIASVNATAVANSASITSLTTTVNANTLALSGLTSSSSPTFAALTVTNAVNSATLTTSGAINAASLTASGAINSATLTASTEITTAGAINAASLSTATLSASGAATLAGVTATSISSSGALTAAGVTTTTLTASGVSALAGVTATSVSSSGTLTASGASVFAGVTATSLSTSGTLTASGASVFAGVTATSVSSSGALSTTTLTASGASTFASVSATTLSASGTTTLASVTATSLATSALHTHSHMLLIQPSAASQTPGMSYPVMMVGTYAPTSPTTLLCNGLDRIGAVSTSTIVTATCNVNFASMHQIYPNFYSSGGAINRAMGVFVDTGATNTPANVSTGFSLYVAHPAYGNTFKASAYFEGLVTIGNNAPTLSNSEKLYVNGNTRLDGTLAVSGTATLAGVTATTLSASGAITGASLTAAGNSVFGYTTNTAAIVAPTTSTQISRPQAFIVEGTFAPTTGMLCTGSQRIGASLFATTLKPTCTMDYGATIFIAPIFDTSIGKFNKAFGVYLDSGSVTTAANVTNGYGLYVLHPAAGNSFKATAYFQNLVTIGSDAPALSNSEKLYVNGAVRIDGTGYITAGSWSPTSDPRIKTNIQPMNETFALETISNLQIYTWQYDPAIFVNRTVDTRTYTGFLATNVTNAYPQAVTNIGNVTRTDGSVVTDVKGIVQDDLQNLAVAAVRQLKREFDALKAEVAAIRASCNCPT